MATYEAPDAPSGNPASSPLAPLSRRRLLQAAAAGAAVAAGTAIPAEAVAQAAARTEARRVSLSFTAAINAPTPSSTA